jgi:hypothetical protein
MIVIFQPAATGCMLSASHARRVKDEMEPGFAASEIDTTMPHPARIYDAFLGARIIIAPIRRRSASC